MAVLGRDGNLFFSDAVNGAGVLLLHGSDDFRGTRGGTAGVNTRRFARHFLCRAGAAEPLHRRVVFNSRGDVSARPADHCNVSYFLFLLPDFGAAGAAVPPLASAADLSHSICFPADRLQRHRSPAAVSPRRLKWFGGDDGDPVDLSLSAEQADLSGSVDRVGQPP